MTALEVLVARPEPGSASTNVRLASRLAVSILALASSCYILFDISGNWRPERLLKIGIDPLTAIVTYVGDWQSSYEVSATLGIGTAMFVAPVIGMAFQAQRGRAIQFVDRISLPQRYGVGVSLDRIGEQLRGSQHLLPSETLTQSLNGGGTVIALPDELTDDCAFPAAHARPRVALTIRRGGRVERAVLVGPCRDGTRLDRDAIRSMYGVFDDALVV